MAAEGKCSWAGTQESFFACNKQQQQHDPGAPGWRMPCVQNRVGARQRSAQLTQGPLSRGAP